MKKKFYSSFAVTSLLVLGNYPFLGASDGSASAGPYKVINAAKVGGAGGFDYVYADTDGRRLYIPRSNRIAVFNLDTLESCGEIPNTNNVHGAAVDSKSHRGFSSSKPVVMWDTQSLATIKTIEVEGGPDGILFDSATQRVFILSHRSPNLTVIDSKDGGLIGTIDIGGAPEQAVSDGSGLIYIDVEDKDNVAVVDTKTLKVTAHYPLADQGKTPAGLAIDAKNHILFVCCRNPATCLVLDADGGKIIAALPIGSGTDGAVFNQETMEAFSSQRDGTLTVIKELSPTRFEVEQNVITKPGAKTCSLDTKTNKIFLITADRTPQSGTTAAAESKPGIEQRGRDQIVPDSFTILVVGK